MSAEKCIQSNPRHKQQENCVELKCLRAAAEIVIFTAHLIRNMNLLYLQNKDKSPINATQW